MIKNIIFDLGNVIIDILPQKTYEAFATLSNKYSWQEIEQLIKEKKLWIGYETGHFTDAEFRDLIRKELSISASDEAIDLAFNALLLEIDPKRIELIENLGRKYRLFILSNTSNIHFVDVEKILERCTGRKHFSDFIEIVFLSYEMGKVKPDPEIYRQVLQDAGIIAEETLFVDDLQANVESAAKLGINIIHIQPPVGILERLKEY
ncbi:putative hydrolase of the HAD superfamily [Pseudarcicella hirudinis]|uniref:Putative hydrolase of the HAD superfamily n=2 Tax=Pseudarcicella hirudinis TaxID=1079859 RepID=A0A1I5MGF7_9BACT|nr:HAD family phosphatase [Pseudarcicella hirudinis]SFP08674.1 putative hydrolase of the HAD superfamily [Pseudarcicella hirudinis]